MRYRCLPVTKDCCDSERDKDYAKGLRIGKGMNELGNGQKARAGEEAAKAFLHERQRGGGGECE